MTVSRERPSLSMSQSLAERLGSAQLRGERGVVPVGFVEQPVIPLAGVSFFISLLKVSRKL